MWILELLDANGVTSKTIYLHGPTITIGRSIDNNISFPQDNTTSRNHAIFYLKDGALICKDISTFGTFMNNNINRMEKNKEIPILNDTMIKFGNDKSIGKIRFVKYSFCPTRLNKNEKEELKSFTKAVNASIAKDIDDCTHVVCNKFSSTMKTIMAIVLQKHIVLLDWLKSFANTTLPSVEIPPIVKYISQLNEYLICLCMYFLYTVISLLWMNQEVE
jgi:hypothetical protein